MGNVYISDYTGRQFSESLTNVVRGTEFVDFEKVNSLDGVFISNKYLYKKPSNQFGKGTRSQITEEEVEENAR